VTQPRKNNKLAFFLMVTAIVVLAVYVIACFDAPLREWLRTHRLHAQAGGLTSQTDTIVDVLRLVLFSILAYLGVAALNTLIFDLILRYRRSFEAPALVRNVFSLVAFTALFFLIFSLVFPKVNLGALFTTSAIFGVILGLALQDTLGNFFAGISMQADRPFQVGDVITVGALRHTGIVEQITWRAIKIRTFANHVILINNNTAAREPIEVCPHSNLNARCVFFNTLYTDSPAKTIHVIREAIRAVDNVSRIMTPVVRIRNLGDSGVEYEVKYWPEDYTRHEETDALIRQWIWYAFRRANLNFAYPTRTLLVERRPRPGHGDDDAGAILERLAAVDIFTPLSKEETAMLARAVTSHVYAPGEIIIRTGDPGSSMFVIHHGRVSVQLSEDGHARSSVATLGEGAFFGEMALLTGEPRTSDIVALEETKVLEIDHAAMKQIFDTNPDLVEALSHIIATRKQGLAASVHPIPVNQNVSDGILSAIKRFFTLPPPRSAARVPANPGIPPPTS
jgi:small-conductance mechanosensitive channel